jgi:hypothetical protein
MDSIVDALYAANTPALGLVGKFGDLTSNSKKMETIMRFLSGSGAWRFLNKLKAIGMMIQGYNDGLTEAAKAQVDAAKEYAREIKAREKLIELQKTLSGKKAATKLQDDEMFQGLKEMYGAKKALSILEEQSTKALAQQTKKLDDIKELHMDSGAILEMANQKLTFDESKRRYYDESGGVQSRARQEKMQKMAEKRGLGKVGEGGKFKEFTGIKKFVMVRFAKITKSVTSISSLFSGLGKMIKAYLSKGLMLIGSMLLWGLVIILGIMLFKPVIMGFIDFASSTFSWITDTFGGWLPDIFGNLMDNLEVVWGAAKHFWDVLFDPNATISDALMALAGLLWSIVWTMLEFIVNLWIWLPVLAVTLIAGILGVAFELLYEIGALAYTWINLIVKMWLGIFKFVLGIPKMLAALISSAIAKIISVISSINPFASGGTVTSSGNILVGERGPEILRVPGASRITPNHQLTNSPTIINNNITVEVKGRMGASDQEIRDVARKVGAMINREINRTTSSGVRL